MVPVSLRVGLPSMPRVAKPKAKSVSKLGAVARSLELTAFSAPPSGLVSKSLLGPIQPIKIRSNPNFNSDYELQETEKCSSMELEKWFGILFTFKANVFAFSKHILCTRQPLADQAFFSCLIVLAFLRCPETGMSIAHTVVDFARSYFQAFYSIAGKPRHSSLHSKKRAS